MRRANHGVAAAVVAYIVWGLFPLYWPLLEPAGPVEILAHRIAWSLVVIVALLLVAGGVRWIGALTRRQLWLLALAAVLVTVNWGTYIHGVNSGQVVETSLGYFLNPLVSIALGVVVLRERLRALQWVAVGIGVLAGVVLTVDYGHVPLIALTLACAFGLYGLVKKCAGVDGLQSLAVETAILFLPAVAYIAVIQADGRGTAGSEGPGHLALLAGGGLVTAIPLILFGVAAVRVRLTTIGLLQYLAPVLQLLIGVLLYREPMPASRLAGFALVWVALALITVDAVRSSGAARATRVGRRAAAAPGSAAHEAAATPTLRP